jgi:tetratricopeptide (TPR) repeat protein
MHLFKGEYETATSYYERLLEFQSPEIRSAGRLLRVLVPYRQGQFKQALAMIEAGMAADEAEGYEGDSYYEKATALAGTYALLGDYDRALSELGEWRNRFAKKYPDDPTFAIGLHVRLLARSGDYEEARKQLEIYRKDVEGYDKSYGRWYSHMLGEVAFAEGQADSAIVRFEELAETHEGFYLGFYLARSYLEADRVIEAINEFERLLRRYSEDRATNPVEGVLLYYYLATGYERAGKPEKAAAKYERFLEFWGDSDTDLEEIREARARLAALRQTG